MDHNLCTNQATCTFYEDPNMPYCFGQAQAQAKPIDPKELEILDIKEKEEEKCVV